MTGRLTGSAQGVPVTIEGDGQTIRIHLHKTRDGARVLSHARTAFGTLPKSKRRLPPRVWPKIRVKIGKLPEVPAPRWLL
jgi:hypothetical protein